MSGLLDPSERLEKLDRLGRILPPLQFSLQNKGFVLRRHRRTRRQRQLALHAPCRLRSAAPVLPQPILHVGRHPNIMASSLIAQDVDKMHTGFNWCPRPELNRDLSFRKRLLYPLELRGHFRANLVGQKPMPERAGRRRFARRSASLDAERLLTSLRPELCPTRPPSLSAPTRPKPS